MTQFQWMLRFAGHKIPLTLLSATALWALTKSGAEMLYAAPVLSLLTQITEFFVMKALVFKNRENETKLVMRQFLAFWTWAATLAVLEGLTMSQLQTWGFGFIATYVLGHTPIFFLRFYGDQAVFNKLHPPSSS